jgi:hypothetical protein
LKNYLDEEETQRADLVGTQRYTGNRERGTVDRLVAGLSTEGRRLNDIWGARAELWFAIVSGLPWTGMAHRADNKADVGQNIEIKTTSVQNGHLIVRPRIHREDPIKYILDHVYVLVIHNRTSKTYRYAGYMKGLDVMQDKYWEGDSWWIPQSDLRKELPLKEDTQWVVQKKIKEAPGWQDVCRFDDETDAELYAMNMVDTYRIVQYKPGHQMDIEEYLT